MGTPANCRETDQLAVVGKIGFDTLPDNARGRVSCRESDDHFHPLTPFLSHRATGFFRSDHLLLAS